MSGIMVATINLVGLVSCAIGSDVKASANQWGWAIVLAIVAVANAVCLGAFIGRFI